MEIMRLIVMGSVGAGKTTLIRSVSEIKVGNTGRQATQHTSLLKPQTAIALDYGRVKFDPNLAVYLYGSVGQVKFDLLWDLLIRRAHACLVLVAANRPGDFRNASRLLAFIDARVQVPTMIGITHTDCLGAWSKEDVTIALGYANRRKQPMVVTVNPTQKASALQSLTTLIGRCNSTKVVHDYIEERIAA